MRPARPLTVAVIAIVFAAVPVCARVCKRDTQCVSVSCMGDATCRCCDGVCCGPSDRCCDGVCCGTTDHCCNDRPASERCAEMNSECPTGPPPLAPGAPPGPPPPRPAAKDRPDCEVWARGNNCADGKANCNLQHYKCTCKEGRDCDDNGAVHKTVNCPCTESGTSELGTVAVIGGSVSGTCLLGVAWKLCSAWRSGKKADAAEQRIQALELALGSRSHVDAPSSARSVVGVATEAGQALTTALLDGQE
jgi:hypothetical protein